MEAAWHVLMHVLLKLSVILQKNMTLNDVFKSSTLFIKKKSCMLIFVEFASRLAGVKEISFYLAGGRNLSNQVEIQAALLALLFLLLSPEVIADSIY